jgi:peptide/nickel transport system permease protein
MRALRFFLSRWQNWLGLFIVLAFTVTALAAPLLSPPNETTQGAFKKVGRQTDKTPHPPSEIAPLGTLPGQLDVYHALIWGARESMQFGLLVALGAFVFGSLFGAIAGYSGGLVNGLMMRIADAFLTFPVLAGVVFLQQLVAMTIESMGGIYWFNSDYVGQVIDFQATPPPFAVFLMKVDPILISLILFSWMPIARLVNTMVITLKNTEFIQAARALGGNPLWIIGRHVLPNSVGPAIVMAARDVGSAVILQATITFVGLGGQSAWGTLLSMGRNWVIGPGGDLFASWWVFMPATLALILFGVGWNLLGDGLAEALEPKASRGGEVIFKHKHKKKAEQVELVPMRSPFQAVYSHRIAPDIPAWSDPLLQMARDAMTSRDFDKALNAYSHLIARGRHVQDTLEDLIAGAQKHPRNAALWKVLGDVLARDGQDENAARAYEQYKRLS